MSQNSCFSYSRRKPSASKLAPAGAVPILTFTSTGSPGNASVASGLHLGVPHHMDDELEKATDCCPMAEPALEPTRLRAAKCSTKCSQLPQDLAQADTQQSDKRTGHMAHMRTHTPSPVQTVHRAWDAGTSNTHSVHETDRRKFELVTHWFRGIPQVLTTSSIAHWIVKDAVPGMEQHRYEYRMHG
eukprot:92157-Amphidinium_carterae.3